jgi:hypothetical protein
MFKTYDLSNEMSLEDELFPEGLRKVKILLCEERVSKKTNNPYLYMKLEDIDTQTQSSFMLTLIKGKRWLFKTLLEAVESVIDKGEGNYQVDLENLIGECVVARIKHEEDKRIVNGEFVNALKNKAARFYSLSSYDSLVEKEELKFKKAQQEEQENQDETPYLFSGETPPLSSYDGKEQS